MLALLLFWPATDYEAEGLKALGAKQYEQAAQLFSQAVQTDPKDYAAHFHLALTYSLLGKDAEAIPEYQKTLDLKPGLRISTHFFTAESGPPRAFGTIWPVTGSKCIG